MARGDLFRINSDAFNKMAQGSAIVRIGHIYYGWHENKHDRQVTPSNISDYSNKQVATFQPLRTEAASSFAKVSSPIDKVQLEFVISKARYSTHVQELYAMVLITPVVPIHNPMIASIMQPYFLDEKTYYNYGHFINDTTDDLSLMRAYSYVPVMCRIDSISMSSIPSHPDDIRLIVTISRVITSNCYGDINLYTNTLDDMYKQEDLLNEFENLQYDNPFVEKMCDSVGIKASRSKDIFRKIREYNNVENEGVATGGNLAIGTYNVHDFETEDAVSIISDMIIENKLDIIICQEHIHNYNKLQLELSSRGHVYNLKTTSNNDSNDSFDDNIAIYSKYRILSAKEIIRNPRLKDPVTDEQVSVIGTRPVFEVSVQFNNVVIWFYCTHFKSGIGGDNETLSIRRAQSYALQQYIKSNRNIKRDLIVIAGDFNTVISPLAGDTNDDFDEEGTISYLCFTDDEDPDNNFVAINKTYMARESTFIQSDDILDHIILSPMMYNRYVKGSVRVVKKPVASDHYPVTIRLGI